VGTFARATVLGLLGLVAACTDSEGAPEPYAVVHVAGWSLQEAVDPPQDDPLTSAERPPMDWYSEYVRTILAPGGTEGQMVRLSAHSASIDDTRAALEEVGFEFDALPIIGWDGVGVTQPEDPGSPALVLLDHGSTTFMLLSYELTLDELTAFAGSVEAVDETTWVASRGVIRG